MATWQWIVQILLGLAFLMAGGMKVMMPKMKLAENMAWVEDFTETQVKIIGGLEVLGALGLLLPLVVDFLPLITPLAAAAGLLLAMIGAAYTHYKRNEMTMIAAPAVLGILALLIVIAEL